MRVVRAAMHIGLPSGFFTAFCAAAVESTALGQATAPNARPAMLVVPIAAGGGVAGIKPD